MAPLRYLVTWPLPWATSQFTVPLGYFQLPNPKTTNLLENAMLHLLWDSHSSNLLAICVNIISQTPWPEIYMIFLGIGRSQSMIDQRLSVTHLPSTWATLIPRHFSCHHCDIGSCHFLFSLLQWLYMDILSINLILPNLDYIPFTARIIIPKLQVNYYIILSKTIQWLDLPPANYWTETGL